MIVHRAIQFDDAEREQINRALQCLGLVQIHDRDSPSRDLPRAVLWRFLQSVRQREVISANRLDEARDAIRDLRRELKEQTTVAYWRGIGAPGSDDAVEGLARERQLQVVRLDVAWDHVMNAARIAGPRQSDERAA